MKVTRREFKDSKNHPVSVTYWTITGRRPGPVLTIVAGQHGMEHSGPCLLPELAMELEIADFRGTVHICPCANPAALALDYEFYPENEDLAKIDDYYYSYFRHYHCPWGLGRAEAASMYNMNRTWNRPGSGLAFDISRWLWEEICEPSDILIDMHGAQGYRPFIFSDFDKNNALLRYPGIEAVIQCPEEKSDYNSGNLNFQAAKRPGKYAFCLEFSIQHALKEQEYVIGKNSVYNLMRGTGMMDGEVIHHRPVWNIRSHYPGTHFEAGCAGHMRFFFESYDEVKAGDRVYEIRDFETLEVLEEGFAGHNGVMCCMSLYPTAKPGQLLCVAAEAELLAPAGVKLEKMEI